MTFSIKAHIFYSPRAFENSQHHLPAKLQNKHTFALLDDGRTVRCTEIICFRSMESGKIVESDPAFVARNIAGQKSNWPDGTYLGIGQFSHHEE